MPVKITRLGVASYLAPDFPLIEENIQALDEAVQEVRRSGNAQVVLDLRRVPFIDSRGLECLLDLSGSLSAEGGSLRLAEPDGLCREILAITRVDEAVAVFENLEGAGRSFL